jgi:TPR repeat protein
MSRAVLLTMIACAAACAPSGPGIGEGGDTTGAGRVFASAAEPFAGKRVGSPLLPALTPAQKCPELARCQRACDTGDDRACEELADRYVRGADAPLAPDLGAALLDRACQHGRGTSCAALGLLYEDGRGVAEDDDRAAALYDEACTRAAGIGCFNLALMIQQGPLPYDKARVGELARASEDLYKKACDAGDLAWCLNLGVIYEGALGHPDQAKAAEIYRKACWDGHADACVNFALGVVAQPGAGPYATRLLQHACDDGSSLGCGVLGQVLYAGRGVPADPPRAVALLRKGCDGGDGNACGVLGAALGLGDKVPRDEQGADAAEERACALGDADGCMVIGGDAADRHDAKRAARGYERACAIGNGEGCWTLAVLRQKHAIDPHTDQAIDEAAVKACKLRAHAGCIVLLAAGKPAPVPSDALPALRAEGCRAGATQLCEAPP